MPAHATVSKHLHTNKKIKSSGAFFRAGSAHTNTNGVDDLDLPHASQANSTSKYDIFNQFSFFYQTIYRQSEVVFICQHGSRLATKSYLWYNYPSHIDW